MLDSEVRDVPTGTALANTHVLLRYLIRIPADVISQHLWSNGRSGVGADSNTPDWRAHHTTAWLLSDENTLDARLVYYRLSPAQSGPVDKIGGPLVGRTSNKGCSMIIHTREDRPCNHNEANHSKFSTTN